MTKSKQAFLSYSHADKEFADKIARALSAKGLSVWFDDWEILPGDSIVQKIFTHGLENCECFLILLSVSSSKSKWVEQELDSAIVRRLQGITRIIPLIKEKCDIPPPLRSLLWVDISSDFETGIDRILQAIHGVSSRPPLGDSPKYVTELSGSVGGLSKLASTVGSVFLNAGDAERGNEAAFEGTGLASLLPMLSAEQLNDAVDELEEYGLVHTTNWMGTAPYEFGQVESTYALFLHFSELCGYDPMSDIKAVAAAAVAKSPRTGSEIQEICKLSPLRINRAVAYLADYDYIDVLKFLGTAPFDFGQVDATRKTRQFVTEHSV